jgi:hypothetical protein
MSSGGAKRKRSSLKEDCSNCGKAGLCSTGHILQYCGFPGGKFYNASDPEAGRRGACKQKRTDAAASKKSEQIAMLAVAESKENQIEVMAKKIEELEKQVKELNAFVVSFRHARTERQRKIVTPSSGWVQGSSGWEWHGKGKGKGQQQQSQSQSQGQLRHQLPSQSQGGQSRKQSEMIAALHLQQQNAPCGI